MDNTGFCTFVAKGTTAQYAPVTTTTPKGERLGVVLVPGLDVEGHESCDGNRKSVKEQRIKRPGSPAHGTAAAARPERVLVGVSCRLDRSGRVSFWMDLVREDVRANPDLLLALETSLRFDGSGPAPVTFSADQHAR